LIDATTSGHFRSMARRRLPGPIFLYIDGAADDEVTYRRNTEAYERCDLVPNEDQMRDTRQCGALAAKENQMSRKQTTGVSVMKSPLQWSICTLLCADAGGHGHYIIKKFETEWLLKLNGELIGRFKSPDEARACAEAGVKTAGEVEEHL